MAAPLILARTFKDAHAFAKDKLGLSFGYYRVVTSPGTIKAVRTSTLYLVPGWDKRPDRFGMKSAIRFTKNTVIDVSEMETPEPVTLDQNVQFAEVVSDDVADFFNIPVFDVEPEPAKPACLDCGLEDDNHDTPDCPGAKPADEPEPAADETPEPETAKAAKPKAKRRSKCKDCEQMHIKGEPCIESESA